MFEGILFVLEHVGKKKKTFIRRGSTMGLSSLVFLPVNPRKALSSL